MSQKKIRHATFNIRNIEKINKNFEELYGREGGGGIGDVGEITTDQVATNPDVLFRDSKGRFKAADEYRDLKNQLEVNRWIVEQLEGVEGGGIEEAPDDNQSYVRKNAGWMMNPSYSKAQIRRIVNHNNAYNRTNSYDPDSETVEFQLSGGPESKNVDEMAATLTNWAEHNTIAFNILEFSLRHADVGDYLTVGDINKPQRAGVMLELTSADVTESNGRYSGVFGYKLVGTRNDDEVVQKNSLYSFGLTKQSGDGGDLPPMDVEPTANTLVKRDSAGNVKASTLVATHGNFGGAQALRSFNLYGEGFDGRLSLQSNQGGSPGLEMTTDGNRTRGLIKLSRAGGVNGTELQVWTSKDDGVIHMPFVFGKGGEFLLREPDSTGNANYNTAGGFKNAGGKIQYRNDGGAWTELGAGSSTLSVSPEQLIETLSTLRDATQDETTVEGLRDAIGNAIGGLIEKFEAQLASKE